MDSVCPEKTERSRMSQRSRLNLTKVSGDLSFDIKKNQQYRLQKHFLRGGKSWHPDTQGWHVPPHSYGPGTNTVPGICFVGFVIVLF